MKKKHQLWCSFFFFFSSYLDVFQILSFGMIFCFHTLGGFLFFWFGGIFFSRDFILSYRHIKCMIHYGSFTYTYAIFTDFYPPYATVTLGVPIGAVTNQVLMFLEVWWWKYLNTLKSHRIITCLQFPHTIWVISSKKWHYTLIIDIYNV